VTHIAVRLTAATAIGAVLLVPAAPGTAHPAGPPVPAAAGTPVEVVLVLDASGSVRYDPDPETGGGSADDVAAAARSVLAGLALSRADARAAVVSYDERARAQTPLSTVTAAAVTAGGLFDQALGDPRSGLGNPAATGYAEHSRVGVGSNWEAALATSEHLLLEAREGAVRVLVHITDGEPTAHLDANGEPILDGLPEQHLQAAARAANRLRDADVRLLVAGVGRARSRIPALVQVSGPGVHQPDSSDARFNPGSDDVILLSDPQRLGELVTEVVAALAPAPGQAVPGAAGESAATPGEERAGAGWTWVMAGAALVLGLLVVIAVLAERRRRQALGIGVAVRRRRPRTL
jgi:hypothetical protein